MYVEAFHTFSSCTDQKISAIRRLRKIALGLPNRGLLVDVGAGNGLVTSALADLFSDVVAIEPNPLFADELARSCPKASVLRSTLFEVRDILAADLVICSHVFFHIPEDLWVDSIKNMVNWLRPGGEVGILLQAPATDCRRLLKTFSISLPNLRHAGQLLQAISMGRVEASIETIPASVNAPDLATATEVSEFMCNESATFDDIFVGDLQYYVDDRCKLPSGRFGFSCDQDLLRIQNRSV